MQIWTKLRSSFYLFDDVQVSFHEATFSFASVRDGVANFDNTRVARLKHGLQAINDLCPPDFVRAAIADMWFLNHDTTKKFVAPHATVCNTFVEH